MVSPSETVVFEWSGRLDRAGWRDRDRVLLWFEGGAVDLDRVRKLLPTAQTPPVLFRELETAGPGLAAVGLALDLQDRPAGALYLHHDDAGRGRYRALRWDPAGGADAAVEQDEYRVWFLPETPEGLHPGDMVHRDFKSLFAALAKQERVGQLSTFWLRRRAGRIDQVCLTFSWMPRLEMLLPDLEPALGPDAARDLRDRADLRLRHLAFPVDGGAPTLTVYFSGDIDVGAAATFDQRRRQASRAADLQAAVLEKHVLGRVVRPTLPAEPNPLETFYDAPDLKPWRQVLGPELFYHHGVFLPGETADPDDDRPFLRAVEMAAGHIEPGSRVYDLGCGWGGPGRYLRRQHGCRVLGVTISRDQYRHGNEQGDAVRLADMERTLPPGLFDVALMLESLEHVVDKAALLRNLRLFCRRLVIRCICQDQAETPPRFDGTMPMVSSARLKALLAEAGWTLIHWRDLRPQTLNSQRVWLKRFESVPPTRDRHFEAFRDYCRRTVPMLETWGRCNPLIELVAE